MLQLMSMGESKKILYDKSLLGRYEILVNLFLYPFGLRSFVLDEVSLKEGDRVLDAGCGDGLLSLAIRAKAEKNRLRDVEQHAFDISADMLEAFKERDADGIDLRRLDVRELSYEDDYFDLIVSSAMLEYVPDLEQALASLRRCLKPGGRMLVFMSRKSPVNSLLFLPFGNPKCYSYGELADAFGRAGFRNMRRHKFPLKTCWLNAWGVIIEASK
jgi:ubiquinone/menaquinone biosynthesis C-methylase UbiE